MNDLRHHLEEIAGPPSATTPDQVAADLTRGRRALRRRRAVQSVAAGAFAVAVAAAALSFTSGVGNPGTNAPATVTQARLVAYTGQQPKGFTIDKVPDGYFIQADNEYALTLAPKRAQNPGPNVDPSKDPVFDKDSFVGKVGIMLESKDQNGPSDELQQTKVKVGDKDGVLTKNLPPMIPGEKPGDPNGDYGWTLWVKQPSGTHLIVQFWEGLNLSRDQMIELGAGVHVNKGAVQGVG